MAISLSFWLALVKLVHPYSLKAMLRGASAIFK
jgi:hypothetical protein